MAENRRSPQGERGLKYPNMEIGQLSYHRRSPQGERGLKSIVQLIVFRPSQVALRKESVD